VKPTFAAAALLSVVTTAAGCSTTLTVKRVDPDSKDDLEGIPFRVKIPCTIRVWAKQQPDKDGKIVYTQVFVKPFELADPSSLYALGIDADDFSSKLLDVKLNDDGTLTSVHVKSEDKTGETLSAIGKQTTSAADAALQLPNAARTAELANVKAANDLATAQAALAKTLAGTPPDRDAALVAALTAYNDALAAQYALDALAFDTTAAQRGNAVAVVRLAQLKANLAYEKAGLADPFPGVFP
jgi:hypothetical protein